MFFHHIVYATCSQSEFPWVLQWQALGVSPISELITSKLFICVPPIFFAKDNAYNKKGWETLAYKERWPEYRVHISFLLYLFLHLCRKTNLLLSAVQAKCDALEAIKEGPEKCHKCCTRVIAYKSSDKSTFWNITLKQNDNREELFKLKIRT